MVDKALVPLVSSAPHHAFLKNIACSLTNTPHNTHTNWKVHSQSRLVTHVVETSTYASIHVHTHACTHACTEPKRGLLSTSTESIYAPSGLGLGPGPRQEPNEGLSDPHPHENDNNSNRMAAEAVCVLVSVRMCGFKHELHTRARTRLHTRAVHDC